MVAEKRFAFWKDKETGYLDIKVDIYQTIPTEAMENATPMDITTFGLEDLQFFNEVIYPDDYIVYGAWGKLYFRCDEGNPGEVFDEMEFFTSLNDWNQSLGTVEEEATVDNLCFRYGAAGIS